MYCSACDRMIQSNYAAVPCPVCGQEGVLSLSRPQTTKPSRTRNPAARKRRKPPPIVKRRAK